MTPICASTCATSPNKPSPWATWHATSAWLWLGSRDLPVLTLVASSGTVVWNHRGEMRVNVSDGEKLAAGTLETLGETASAQLLFADGTVISLTNKRTGGYGGNFGCKIGRNELRPDAEGWCELEIPLNRFMAVDHRAHVVARNPTPAGNIVASSLLSSFKPDTGLTVAHFELSTLIAPFGTRCMKKSSRIRCRRRSKSHSPSRCSGRNSGRGSCTSPRGRNRRWVPLIPLSPHCGG